MKPLRRKSACCGFTLVEIIIVMVVMALAAATLAALSAKIFDSDTDNRNLQGGNKLLQECAEKILATRLANGYAAAGLSGANSTICNDLGTFTVNFNQGQGDTLGAACPYTSLSTTTCKLVTIAVTVAGDTQSSVSLMLVEYP